MALILSIETSTDVCSVALHNDNELLAAYEIHKGRTHAEIITTLIENCLSDVGHGLNQLDAIAISKGPGSYTGLRIGTSTAKGLCMSLDIPLIAIDTLKSMALELKSFYSQQILFCPMLDARRMEVYCSLFNQDLEPVIEVLAMVLDESSFSETLRLNQTCFFGNGSNKYKDVCDSSNALFVDGIYPSAKYIGKLAYHEYLVSNFVDLAYYEPFYLKDFLILKPKQK